MISLRVEEPIAKSKVKPQLNNPRSYFEKLLAELKELEKKENYKEILGINNTLINVNVAHAGFYHVPDLWSQILIILGNALVKLPNTTKNLLVNHCYLAAILSPDLAPRASAILKKAMPSPNKKLRSSSPKSLGLSVDLGLGLGLIKKTNENKVIKEKLINVKNAADHLHQCLLHKDFHSYIQKEMKVEQAIKVQ